MSLNQQETVDPWRRIWRHAIVPALLVPAVALVSLQTRAPDGRNEDWTAYGGNKAGNRYSPLTQINVSNVSQLKVAWEYDAAKRPEGAPAPRRAMEIQCQPIVVHGILYGTTPTLNLFALNAATGEELWKFDPFAGGTPRFHVNRGVMYWEKGDDRRVLYTAGNHLFAIDAKTGKLVASFGEGGKWTSATALPDGRAARTTSSRWTPLRRV